MKNYLKMRSITLIIISSIFLSCFANLSFLKNVFIAYPINKNNILFLLSLIIILCCVNIIIFCFFNFKLIIKPFFVILFLATSLTAYFMDSYNVIIDDSMIDNIFKTDVHEGLDLFSIKLLIYFMLMGILPSIFITKIELKNGFINKDIKQNLKLISSCFLIIITLTLCFGNFYASFYRQNKSLRFYTNPSYYLYSIIKYAANINRSTTHEIRVIAQDAKISESDEQRELIVLVVGETARADNFSLNGYTKLTNPLLQKENVISFSNVWSCGTSTAYSLPCMFSVYNKKNFNKTKSSSSENILDVIKKSGINVIWLDNNSNSKGVADRVEYSSYKSKKTNSTCDIECRDEGMLANLAKYISNHPRGDILIVLHQMGNHGPAYYKRYPERFEQFRPTCQTNQLERCSNEEITNAYDNAILYTDYFLAKTITLLKKYDSNFETAMLYISDHGESLGEHNVYLHGLPYSIAPDVQKHIPMILWFGSNFDQDEINIKRLSQQKDRKLSHDNLFHTLLGLMEVETNIYNSSLDITKL